MDVDKIADEIADEADDSTKDETEGGLYEIREFNDGTRYKVLVIDSPKKWKKAIDVKFVDVVEKDGKLVTVEMTCISSGANDFANEAYPIPESTSQEEAKSPDFIQKTEKAKAIRKVLFFENALRVTLPGSNNEEKADALVKMPGVYIDKLFDLINKKACAITDGDMPEFFERSRKSGESIKKISNEDLFSFPEEKEPTMFCRFQRPFESFMVEIPLLQLSTEDRNRIEAENQIPDPPMRPGKGFDTKNPEPFINEPGYQAKVKRIKMKKTIAYITACLPFEIPGDNASDKNKWLSDRICGDVLKLQLYIQNEIVDYSWGLNFF